MASTLPSRYSGSVATCALPLDTFKQKALAVLGACKPPRVDGACQKNGTGRARGAEQKKATNHMISQKKATNYMTRKGNKPYNLPEKGNKSCDLPEKGNKSYHLPEKGNKSYDSPAKGNKCISAG
eukprot:6202329-Pleurochrysis_carterae.AAC.1